MDRKHYLKKLLQKPVVQDIGKAASSGLVEALKQADGISSLVPVPGLKLALQSLLALIQAVDQTAQNSDAAKRLQHRIESLTTSVLLPIKQVDLKDIPNELVIELGRLAMILETNVTNCRVKISHGRLHRFIRREDDQKDIENMSKAIDEAVTQFLLVGTISLAENMVPVRRGVDELQEQNQIILFKKAANANHSYQSAQSAQRFECLDGTRVDVLKQIRAFLEDSDGVNLFWLSGIAGSGKSTIAQSAAVEATLLADCIVASFFFSRRGHAELSDASMVFPTLAYQLWLADTDFRKHVSRVIKEQPNIFEQDYTCQFRSLIAGPLKAMDRTQPRIFIVLDALDECEQIGATAVLNALLEKNVDVPKELKVLITGRPEAHLRRVLYTRENIRKLNLQDIEAKSDIRHYLFTTFKQPPIALATPFDAREEVISRLAESAGDSFIYATTILRFVFDEHDQDPQRRLDILLGNRTDSEEHPYERLDALYLSILHPAITSNASSHNKRRLRSVLSQLVTFREPLPIAVMEQFCGLKSGDVRRALHHLHSLIQVPDSDDQAPRVYHLSFSDFITDPARCGDKDLVVDVDSAERDALLSCFSLLSSQLHRNIAGIDDPSLPHSEIDGFQTKVEKAVSPELRYACLYWASHLMKIKGVLDKTVWLHFHEFLSRCLLWWIEAMALLDTLREAVESVDRVRTWMTSFKGQVGDRSSPLEGLLGDAFRFLSYHADTISFNALHIYYSALPFTPTESHLRKIYAHELKTSVNARSGLEQRWDPMAMIMQCNEPIWSVSFSPNGRLIAAAKSKSMEIRDALIGTSMISIDLPTPLFYVSSYSDELDVWYRLKELVQKPATVELEVVEVLERGEEIASLAPISGLKNVLGSLVTLIHAGYEFGLLWQMETTRLEVRIKSFTEVVLRRLKKKKTSDVPRQTVNDLEELTRTIEALTATCRQRLSQGRLEGFTGLTVLMSVHLRREVSLLYSRISNAIEQFMSRETMQLPGNVVGVKRRIKPTNPSLLTCAQRAECLEGTRTVVLDEIMLWLKDAIGPRLFWLSGIAGSGKSAIAQSASVRAALLAGHLVASVFFSQFGYAGLCDPSSVFQTLAFQFSLLDVGYKEHVSEVIDIHPNIREMDLRFQYKKLIIEPLDAIRRPHKCILVVLDGLDECDPHEVAAILKVLLDEDVDHPKELKILTASRPEAHLRRIFDCQDDIRKLSLEDVETESDIQHYLRTSFEQPPTAMVNPFSVAKDTVSELAKRARNSFIYAATIVRFVFDEQSQDPQEQIDFLLSHRANPEEHTYTRLDALFLSILRQAFSLGVSDDEKHQLRTVLGLLVCIREPFPMDKMETLYDLEPGCVGKALHHLRSFIHVPGFNHWAPYIYHRSFTDFIVDPARCPDRDILVDIGSTENRIFNKCSSLWTLWSQNKASNLWAIDLAKPSSTDSDLFTEERYACLYWASHLTKIKDVDESTQYYLDDRCLLRWLETMALLGMLREAVTHIGRVRSWMISLNGQADKASDRLVDLMDDAFRLLPHHATVISYDFLLIYGSALFGSTKFQPQVVEVTGRHSNSSHDCLREFSAHSDSVTTTSLKFKFCYDFTRVLAWSPNSELIAVSRVNSVEIRSAPSGSIVDSFNLSPPSEHVLDPKKVSCLCFAFYPDNSRIAYASRGGRVHVRDTLAMTEVFAVTDDQEGLLSIDVAQNGKLLVSGSKSGRIRVSNADIGDPIWAVETDSELQSTSIAPNSQLIVSLSSDAVRIWNANDGNPLSILPYYDVISISFSPDSNQLASVDQEGLVRIWGMSQVTTDSEPIQEWRIFAERDHHLPAGGRVGNMQSLNYHGGNATLNWHASPVTSLTFSADGHLASGSLDGTIRVWAISSAENSRVEKDINKLEEFYSLLWSPRGLVVVAFNYFGDKVRVWNTEDGTFRVDRSGSGAPRLTGGIGLLNVSLTMQFFRPVSISDCGQYLAAVGSQERIATRRITSSAARSNTVLFHAPASDSHLHTFFPGSTRFATTSQNEIFTWDASVARPEVISLGGHSMIVDGLYFAPDGSRLLSSAGEEVFAWNIQTLQLVSVFDNAVPHPHPVIKAKEDWVVMILPGRDELRHLFRLPLEYQPREDRFFGGSWSSKRIFIGCKDGNVLIVDFSALPASMTDFTDSDWSQWCMVVAHG
ncbi:hypothetical protein EI94DRAFT_1715265 [Lactarius quietus]|nr:hypothetical protein EI94DRAFT_1715265 [Lactarius quietus]